jgi:hypothetical protein
MSVEVMPNASKKDYEKAIDKLSGFLERAGVSYDDIQKKREELTDRPADEIVRELAKFLSATHKQNAIDKLVRLLKKAGVEQDETEQKRNALKAMPQNAIVKEIAKFVADARARNALEAADAATDGIPPGTWACHYPSGSGSVCSDLYQDECGSIPLSQWHGDGYISPHTCEQE